MWNAAELLTTRSPPITALGPDASPARNVNEALFSTASPPQARTAFVSSSLCSRESVPASAIWPATSKSKPDCGNRNQAFSIASASGFQTPSPGASHWPLWWIVPAARVRSWLSVKCSVPTSP